MRIVDLPIQELSGCGIQTDILVAVASIQFGLYSHARITPSHSKQKGSSFLGDLIFQTVCVFHIRSKANFINSGCQTSFVVLPNVVKFFSGLMRQSEMKQTSMLSCTCVTSFPTN
jgi:hypothetical protein